MGSQFAELIQGTTVRGKVYRMLVTLFAIMLVSTAGYLAYSQRALVEGQVERQARDLAVEPVPREKLLTRPDVVDARSMRGPAITKLFGPGDASAKAVDGLDRRALDGESISEIRDGADRPIRGVRLCLPITPFPISSATVARGVPTTNRTER